mgnify:CR=1 FL=1
MLKEAKTNRQDALKCEIPPPPLHYFEKQERLEFQRKNGHID